LIVGLLLFTGRGGLPYILSGKLLLSDWLIGMKELSPLRALELNSWFLSLKEPSFFFDLLL